MKVTQQYKSAEISSELSKSTVKQTAKLAIKRQSTVDVTDLKKLVE